MLVSIAAVEADIADAAAIGAAARGLQLGDDLHGPDLRRPGDGAAGKGGAQQIDGVVPASRSAVTVDTR